MANVPVITDATDLSGKNVLVRAAFNLPLTDGAVSNTFRLMQALPTIEFLREAGARVILMSHIGRDTDATLAPVSEVLAEHIAHVYVADTIGEEAVAAVAAMNDGDVVLLENLRQHDGEKANDPAFAEALAALADLYVNDDFPVSHRAAASIVGVPALLPSHAGITFAREYEELSKALQPNAPALFILGGAKFDTKLPLVEKFLDTYDQIFIGGALVNDFFKGLGYEVGRSLVSDIDLSGSPLLSHPKILLPVDVVAVNEADEERVTMPTDVRPDEVILDVGPATLAMLALHIQAAETILWNGPLGNYEGGYARQTEGCAELIAAASGYAIVGGGDTVAAIESLNIEDKFDFLSTAGGAMLTFLEEGTLPGIDALVNK